MSSQKHYNVNTAKQLERKQRKSDNSMDYINKVLKFPSGRPDANQVAESLRQHHMRLREARGEAMKKHGFLAIVAHGCIKEFESYTVPKDINLIFVAPPACYAYAGQLDKLLTNKESIKQLLDPSIPIVDDYLIDRVRGGTKISNMVFTFRHDLGLQGVYALPFPTQIYNKNENRKMKLQSLMHKYNLLNINSLRNNTSSPATISMKALLEYLGPGTYIIESCRVPCTGKFGSVVSSLSRKIPFLKTSLAQNEDRFRATLPANIQTGWDSVPNRNRPSFASNTTQFHIWNHIHNAKDKANKNFLAYKANKNFLADKVAPSMPERVLKALHRNKKK